MREYIRESSTKIRTLGFGKEEVLEKLGVTDRPGWTTSIGIYEADYAAGPEGLDSRREWELVITQHRSRDTEAAVGPEQTPHQRGMLDVDEHGRWPDWDGPPRDVTDTRRKF